MTLHTGAIVGSPLVGSGTLKSFGIRVPGQKADMEDLTEASMEL
jgi:hypothetical protein